MSTPDGRAVIAQYFRDYASWQRQKTPPVEILFDGSDSTAEDIDAFAQYVLALPARDARIETLQRLAVLEGDNVVSPGPRFSSALADIRHYGAGSYDVFLDYLVHVAIDDAIESSRQPVPMLIDSLHEPAPRDVLSH